MHNISIDIFSAQNIDYGYMYPQSIFCVKKKRKKEKKLGIPREPQFYYINVGFKGYTFHGHAFLISCLAKGHYSFELRTSRSGVLHHTQ